MTQSRVSKVVCAADYTINPELGKQLHSAIKQLLNAFSPDNQVAFREFVIVEHPRKGEYSFGFLTGEVFLTPAPSPQPPAPNSSEEALFAVYIPTNHLYLGDLVLLRREDVIHPGLSIRDGIQIILSGGTAIPRTIMAKDAFSSQRSTSGLRPTADG